MAFVRWLVLSSPLAQFSPLSTMDIHIRTFFDTLPADAHGQILRHVSARPRHRHWQAFVAPSDGGALLHRRAPLRAVARELLNSMIITPSLTRQSPSLYFLSIDDEAELNWILRWSAQNVDSILVRYGSARLPTTWLTYIARHCVALKKLELHEDVGDDSLERLLRGRGPFLEELTVWHLYSRERIELVSRYCKSLKQLGVRHLLCQSESLWSSVGPQLLRLHVLLCGISYPTGRLDPGATLHGIRTHCRSLVHLHVEEPFEAFDLAVAALYASYGAQLEHANVLELSPSACAVVAAACPSLSLRLAHRDSVAMQCRVLGEYAESVSFEGDAPDEVALSEGLAGCRKLTSISPAFLRYWTPDQVGALSSAPLPQIECFEMRDVFLLPEAEAALLTLLASESGALRQLAVAVHVHGPARFNDIAERNPYIRSVRLSISASEENEGLNARIEALVLHTLQAFTVCASLRELIVDHVGGIIRDSTVFSQWIDTIADATVSYRIRGAYVKVGDIDYLP